jgi:LL-diaminopimelate aminotransferase
MITINRHYDKLHANYLFSTISRRVAEFQKANPTANIIKMGIGDFTKALPAACITAFHRSVDEMASDATFRGYGPEQGYDFLREAAARVEFTSRGASISADEIFISDGAKCDTGNIQELFSTDSVVAVQDPVYPVYVDTNVMAGRTGEWSEGRYGGLVYLESGEENGFVAEPPEIPVDLVYLCFPNNPTGTVASSATLERWVEYAKHHRALILFDAAYAAYIRDDALPHTIYEIPGAEEVAVEFRSFSKTAGFTGTRCAYTVIPKRCRAFAADGSERSLHELWNRRHTTKFNGVSYPVQRAAEAVYSAEGLKEIRSLADFFLGNAKIIREGFERLGLKVYGGVHSPYIWVRTGSDSWEFFDRLLSDAHVVCTPGAGFGRCGEGYVRFSAFNARSAIEEAMARIERVMTAEGT